MRNLHFQFVRHRTDKRQFALVASIGRGELQPNSVEAGLLQDVGRLASIPSPRRQQVEAYLHQQVSMAMWEWWKARHEAEPLFLGFQIIVGAADVAGGGFLDCPPHLRPPEWDWFDGKEGA